MLDEPRQQLRQRLDRLITPPAAVVQADKLNAAGLTTGTGRAFDIKAVQWIRHAYNVPAPAAYADGEVSVAEAATKLGCSTGTAYDWTKTGKLAARRGAGNRLCIPWTDQTEAGRRRRVAESGHLNPAARRTKPRPATRDTIKTVAAAWHHHVH